MKYSDRYPNAKPQEFAEVEPGLIVGYAASLPCCWCGAETPFMDIDMEEPVCSEVCRQELTKEFYRTDGEVLEGRLRLPEMFFA